MEASPDIQKQEERLTTNENWILNRACEFCRSRKLKCDRVRPKCHHCKERGINCSYSIPLKRGPKPKSKENLRADGIKESTKNGGNNKSKLSEIYNFNDDCPIDKSFSQILPKVNGEIAQSPEVNLSQDKPYMNHQSLSTSTSTSGTMINNIQTPYQEPKFIKDGDTYIAGIVYVFVNRIFIVQSATDIFNALDNFILDIKQVPNTFPKTNMETVKKAEHYITEMVTLNQSLCLKLPSFPIFQGALVTYLYRTVELQHQVNALNYHYKLVASKQLSPSQLQDHLFSIAYTLNSYLSYYLTNTYLQPPN